MEKRNGRQSNVYGATFEARGNYNRVFQVEAGITLQRSRYANPVQWSEQLNGIRSYLRSPDTYGYFTSSLTPGSRFSASVSGIYTGTMNVPHYGLAGDPGTPEMDVLFRSPEFLEGNIKFAYIFNLKRLDTSLELSGGVNNFLNHYQDDFDTGRFRDSGFIYGPARPRTYFIGLRIFN